MKQPPAPRTAKGLGWLAGGLIALALLTSGCGRFVARRMVQAPNTYPQWLAPHARVLLNFEVKFPTNFPAYFVTVGPPAARLRYRIVEPADYGCAYTSTRWMERGQPHFSFTFSAHFSALTNTPTPPLRGTVVLLHGYGLAHFTMTPWALRLAQEGWRCLLVDLRGHGKSTGDRVYYGLQETHDLSQLLDQLAQDGQLTGPVAALGESYGAALALRWKTTEPRIERVVAIAPYAVLSNAVQNICREYAHWLPRSLPKAGMKALPELLGVPAEELDPLALLSRTPVPALFITATGDKISPPAEVRRLFDQAAPEKELLIVPDVSHEALPFCFHELVPPVVAWLNATNGAQSVVSGP